MNSVVADTTIRFGMLLKRWRNARRLSQLDLALESGISQRHVSFLESGRARPSRSMVLQLAEALHVPLRESNLLLQAAGFAAAYRERDLDAAVMAPVRDALELILAHHEPYPALVVDRDWNLQLANAAVARLLAVLGDVEAAWARTCGDGPRNVVRLIFHPEGLRPFIANWEQSAPQLLQRLQREMLTAPSEGLGRLIEELRADPTVPRRWHVQDPELVLAPVLPVELLASGARLKLFSMLSTFGTPQDVTTDELRVETFFPADDATAAALRGLASQS